MGTVRAYVVALAALLLQPAGAGATDFRVGPVEGLLDLTLSYGLLFRTESRDKKLIGIGNGGKAPSVNRDDGNLNYSRGLVTNGARATAELTLFWGPFGAHVRGYGFYDFETDLEDRPHRDLTGDAENLVGSGGELQDYFLSARVEPYGVPVTIRVGNQLINWGETNFLRLGVDVVNPLDLLAVVLPTTTTRDLYMRQGMVWAAANLTEVLSVEGFYQYDWVRARTPPTGWFFSANDIVGDDGARFAMEGFGEFSDLGTDLDAFFGLEDGTLGFDEDFMRIPTEGRKRPNDQGQFGFTIQAILPRFNASKVALHFMNYHSRLPIVMGRTADRFAVSLTTDEAVDARASALADETGLSFEEARDIEETLTVGRYSNETRSFVKYPENLRMLGFSFNTATVRTGTLVSGEISHHFRWPVQIPTEEVISASLSPIQFTDVFDQTSLGSFGPDERVKGFARVDKTQAALSVIQLFGPRLGATQSLVGVDLGWVYFDDLPKGHPADPHSWGYRLAGSLRYEGILGGFGVRPGVAFAHDVDGVSAGPAGAFLEDRKTLSFNLAIEYIRTWTANITYFRVFDGGRANVLRDRDFVRINLSFRY